jgi:hypothetical protein
VSYITLSFRLKSYNTETQTCINIIRIYLIFIFKRILFTKSVCYLQWYHENNMFSVLEKIFVCHHFVSLLTSTLTKAIRLDLFIKFVA